MDDVTLYGINNTTKKWGGEIAIDSHLNISIFFFQLKKKERKKKKGFIADIGGTRWEGPDFGQCVCYEGYLKSIEYLMKHSGFANVIPNK